MRNQQAYVSNTVKTKPFTKRQEHDSNEKSLEIETGDIMDEEVEEFKESSKRDEYGDFEGKVQRENEVFRIELPAQFESFEEFVAFIEPELHEATKHVFSRTSARENIDEEGNGEGAIDEYDIFDFYGAVLKGVVIPRLYQGSLVFYLSNFEDESMDEQSKSRLRAYIREDFLAMIGKRKGRSLDRSELKFTFEDNNSLDVNIQLNNQELYPLLADLVQRYEAALEGRSDSSYSRSYFDGVAADETASIETKVNKLLEGLYEYFGEGQGAERTNSMLGGSFELVPAEQGKFQNSMEEEKNETFFHEQELCQRLIEEYNRPEEFIQCNPENSSIMFATRLFESDKISNCSIYTVILAYLVFQLRVKRVLEELSDSNAVEELIQTARYIPFPNNINELQSKLVVGKALDLIMEPELENCMPHSAYNKTLKRFSEDTHQMNVEALNLCLSFCDLYYLEHCMTSTEAYTRLNIYRQQLDALVSTYNCCAEETNNQKSKPNPKTESLRLKQIEAVYEKAKQVIGFEEYQEFELLLDELNKASTLENNEEEMRDEENIRVSKKSKSPLLHRSPLANLENSPQVKLKNKMEVEKPQEISDTDFSPVNSRAKHNFDQQRESTTPLAQLNTLHEKPSNKEQYDEQQQEQQEEEELDYEEDKAESKMVLENEEQIQRPQQLANGIDTEPRFWMQGENFSDKARTSRELERFLNEAPKDIIESIDETTLQQLYDDLEKVLAWKELYTETFETDIEKYIRSKFESDLKDPNLRNNVYNIKSQLDHLHASFSEDLEKYPDLQNSIQLIQKYLNWINWSFRVEETISSIDYGAKIASFGDLKELFSDALKFDVPKTMEFYQRVEHWHDVAYDLLRDYRAKFQNEKYSGGENNLNKSLEKDSVKKVVERLRNRLSQVEALRMREDLENKTNFVSFSEEIERINQALEDYEKWQSQLEDLIVPASRRLIELAKGKDDMSTDHEQIGEQIGAIKNDFALLNLRNDEDELKLNSLEWQYRTFLLMKKLNKEANAEEWKKLTKYSTEHPDIDPSTEKIFSKFLTEEMSNWKKYQKIVKSLKKKEKSKELQSHEDIQKLLSEMKTGVIKLPGDEKFLEELLSNSKTLVTRAYRLINTNEKASISEFNKLLEQIKQFPITLKAEEENLESAIEKANKLASFVKKNPTMEIADVEKTLIEYRQCPILITEVVKLQQNFEDSKKTSHKILLEALKLNDNSSLTFTEIQNISQKVDSIVWDHDHQLSQAKMKVFTQKIQILQKLSNSKAETQTKITVQMLKNFVNEGQRVKQQVVETQKLNQALFWIESLLHKAEEKVSELDSIKSIDALDRMPKVVLGIIDFTQEIEKRKGIIKSAPRDPVPQSKPKRITDKESKAVNQKAVPRRMQAEEDSDEIDFETDPVFRRDKPRPTFDAVGPIREILEKNENLILSGKEAKDIAEKLISTFKLVAKSPEKLVRFISLLKNILKYPNIARDLVEKKFDIGEVKYWLKRNDDELLLRDRRLEDPFKKNSLKPPIKEPELTKRVHSGEHLKNMLENSNPLSQEPYLSDMDEPVAIDLTQKSRNANNMFRESLMRSKDETKSIKLHNNAQRLELGTKTKTVKLEKFLDEDTLAENLSPEERNELLKMKAGEKTLKKVKRSADKDQGKEDLDASSIYQIFDGTLKTTEDKMAPEIKMFSCNSTQTIEEVPEISDPLIVQGRMTLQKFTPLFNKILSSLDSDEHLVVSGWAVSQTADYQACCERIAQSLAHANSIGVAKYLDNAKIFFLHRDQIPIQWERIFNLQSKIARKISQYALLAFVLVYKPAKTAPNALPINKITPVPLSSLQGFVKPKSSMQIKETSFKPQEVKTIQKSTGPVRNEPIKTKPLEPKRTQQLDTTLKSKPLEPKRAQQFDNMSKSKPAESKIAQKPAEPIKSKPAEPKPIQKSNDQLRSKPLESKVSLKQNELLRNKPLEPAVIQKPNQMPRSLASETKRVQKSDNILRNKPIEPQFNQKHNEPLRPKPAQTKRSQELEDLLSSPLTPEVQSLDEKDLSRKDSLSFDEFEEEEPRVEIEPAKPKISKPPVINILPEFINMDSNSRQMSSNNQGNSNSFRSIEGSNRNRPPMREQMRPRMQPPQDSFFEEEQGFENQEMYKEEMNYSAQMRPNIGSKQPFNNFNKQNFQRNYNNQNQSPRRHFPTHNEPRRAAAPQQTSAPSFKDLYNTKRMESNTYQSRVASNESRYPKPQQFTQGNNRETQVPSHRAADRNGSTDRNGATDESQPNPYYLEYLKSRSNNKTLSSSPLAQQYLGYSPSDNKGSYATNRSNNRNNQIQNILEEDDTEFDRRPTSSSFNRPNFTSNNFSKPNLNQKADLMANQRPNNGVNKYQNTPNSSFNKHPQNLNPSYKGREGFVYSNPINPASNKITNDAYPKLSKPTFQTKKW